MKRTNPADAEAERLLALQRSMSRSAKAPDILLISLLSLFVCIFGILIFALPKKTFSELENRTLAGYPEFSAEEIFSGKYAEKMGKFCSDQFPARKFFVGLKAASELSMLKMQNNGVILCKNDTIVKRGEYNDRNYGIIAENMSAVDEFAKKLKKSGKDLFLVIAPNAIDVLKGDLPPLFGFERTDKLWEKLKEYDPDADLYANLLRDHAQKSEYMWYRTDHHWTTSGAYEVYVKLGEKAGFVPYPPEYFEQETATREFSGTTYSSSGMYGIKPDEIRYFRYEGDDEYMVENMITGERLKGFYDRSYLTKKDKYGSFTGGNEAYLRIQNGESKPVLLLIKDSFANCLVPFLAIHYDVHMIDLRFYRRSPYKLCKEIHADKVLIVAGADNIADSDTLTYLKFGLNSD